MTWQGALLAAHIICVTLGYSVLIVVASGVAPDAAARLMRISGPLLGVGLLLGFIVVWAMGLPFTAKWLIASYVLVILAMAWSRIAMNMKLKPPIGALGLSVLFVLLVTVMTLRPY